jgi:hypothetical protein
MVIILFFVFWAESATSTPSSRATLGREQGRTQESGELHDGFSASQWLGTQGYLEQIAAVQPCAQRAVFAVS